MSFVYPGILQYGFPEVDLTKLNQTRESILAFLFRFPSATLSFHSNRMIKSDIK